MATKTNDVYTANRERRKLRKIVEGASSESGYSPGQAGSIFSVGEDGTAPDARRLADKNDKDAYDKDFVRKVREGLKAAGSNVSVADAVGAAQDHHERQIRRGMHGKTARAAALGTAAPAEKQGKKNKRRPAEQPAASAAKTGKKDKRRPAGQPAASAAKTEKKAKRRPAEQPAASRAASQPAAKTEKKAKRKPAAASASAKRRRPSSIGEEASI